MLHQRVAGVSCGCGGNCPLQLVRLHALQILVLPVRELQDHHPSLLLLVLRKLPMRGAPPPLRQPSRTRVRDVGIG